MTSYLNATTRHNGADQIVVPERDQQGETSVADLSGGIISAGVEIIAGDSLGNHAKMTDSGFKVFTEDLEDGIPNEIIRMGSDTGDLFAITDASGQIRASISEHGSGAFTGLSVDATEFDAEGNPTAGLTVYGTEFLDWISALPQGHVAQGIRTTSSAYNSVVQEYQQLDATLKANRLYRLSATSYLTNDGAGRALMHMRYTDNGTVPVAASTALTSGRMPIMGAAVSHRVHLEAWYSFAGTPGTEKDFRMLLTCVPEGGGNARFMATATEPCYMSIDDFGLFKGDTGIDRTTGSPAPTKKTYTSTWNASNSADYLGTNSADTYSSDLKHGYSSASGDSHACIVFAGNAVSGETGKTISTALSGATLKKVEAYLYANHWYYNSGGTAIIRAYNSTSLSSSTPSGTIKSVSNWPKPGGKWVDITSISTASIRGVTLGKAGTTNLTYYGRFNGHAQSGGKPQLRLTYTR